MILTLLLALAAAAVSLGSVWTMIMLMGEESTLIALLLAGTALALLGLIFLAKKLVSALLTIALMLLGALLILLALFAGPLGLLEEMGEEHSKRSSVEQSIENIEETTEAGDGTP